MSAVALSIPVAYLAVRFPRLTSRLISRVCQVGYALPGVVVALSLILLINRGVPFLYGTPFMVVLAYIVRHIPQAVRSSESALMGLSPSLEEAAQSLGAFSIARCADGGRAVDLSGSAGRWGVSLSHLTQRIAGNIVIASGGF